MRTQELLYDEGSDEAEKVEVLYRRRTAEKSRIHPFIHLHLRNSALRPQLFFSNLCTLQLLRAKTYDTRRQELQWTLQMPIVSMSTLQFERGSTSNQEKAKEAAQREGTSTASAPRLTPSCSTCRSRRCDAVTRKDQRSARPVSIWVLVKTVIVMYVNREGGGIESTYQDPLKHHRKTPLTSQRIVAQQTGKRVHLSSIRS